MAGALGRLAAGVKATLGRDRRPPSSAPASEERDRPRSTAPTGSGAGTDGIEVAYSPQLDGDPDPGEVVWAWVPYEDDPTQGKDRPVLVLGTDGPLLAAVQLSSKDHSVRGDHGDWLEVGRGAWDPGGRVSYADAQRLLRLDPSSVRREGAILDRPRFDLVLDRVKALHHWRP